jgi:preprotein translocase subunit SecB
LGTDTGINFIKVSLSEIDFKLNKQFKLPKDGIPVEMGLDIKHSFSKDGKTLTVILSIFLFHKTKNTPFKMAVSVEGIFTGEDPKALRDFSAIHAPAHLLPFAREVIGNTTLRANIPPLLLPPFNVSTLVEELKSKK